MGLLLDIVPNHMGVGNDSQWWQDVLENGRASEYASYFDIDWSPLNPDMKDKLLLPILGSQYGDELEAKRIQVVVVDGRLMVKYFDHLIPIAPRSIPLIFPDEELDELGVPQSFREILRDTAHIPPHEIDGRDAGGAAAAAAGRTAAAFAGGAGERGDAAGVAAGAGAHQRRGGRCAEFRSPARAAGAAALPSGVLAGVERGDQLPAIFRHQRSGRAADGERGGFRGDARADSQAAGARGSDGAEDRPLRRDVQSAAVSDPAAVTVCGGALLWGDGAGADGAERDRSGSAGRDARMRLGCGAGAAVRGGGEDSGAEGTAAAGVAGAGDFGIRLRVPGQSDFYSERE